MHSGADVIFLVHLVPGVSPNSRQLDERNESRLGFSALVSASTTYIAASRALFVLFSISVSTVYKTTFYITYIALGGMISMLQLLAG